MKDLKYWLILAFCLIFFWFLLTFRLIDVPPGINGDEATLGYNALLLSQNLRDETGRFLPIFISAHDGKDWKPPVSMYTTVIFFKLFGPSYFVLRSVSVFLILLSGLLLFISLKNLLDIKLAFLGLLVFMTIPAVIIQSHLALENIALLPFVILWIFMLIKYQKTEKNRYLILSGISLGVGLYSYGSLRLMAPIFAILTVFYILKTGKFVLSQKMHRIVFFTVGLLPFILFFLVIKKEYPGALGNYNRPVIPASYQEFFLPYLSSYDLSFLFIKGDSTPYHSTGTQGMFLLATLPLFLLGIYQCLVKKDSILIMILAAFFTAPLLFGLVSSIYRGSRLLALIPPYIVITPLGFLTILNLKKRLLRNSLFILMMGLIVVNYTDFLRDYWFEYPKRIQSDFAKPYHLVFERAQQLAKEKKLEVFIQHDFRTDNSIVIDFFEQAYFSNKLKLWQEDQPLPQNSIIITSDHNLSKNKDKEQEKIDDYGFGLLIIHDSK